MVVTLGADLHQMKCRVQHLRQPRCSGNPRRPRARGSTCVAAWVLCPSLLVSPKYPMVSNLKPHCIVSTSSMQHSMALEAKGLKFYERNDPHYKQATDIYLMTTSHVFGMSGVGSVGDRYSRSIRRIEVKALHNAHFLQGAFIFSVWKWPLYDKRSSKEILIPPCVSHTP